MTDSITRLHIAYQMRNEDADRGAALAEYGLLLALVALGAMTIMSVFGETLSETFGFASDTFNNSPALANSE